MKRPGAWRVGFSLVLLGASAAVYGIHYLLFRDARHIALYLVGDIAFLFINVLVVTLVIERILALREKRALLQKLNMVIGTFFSEVGLDLLRSFGLFVRNAPEIAPRLVFGGAWGRRDFDRAVAAARDFAYKVQASPAGLRELRDRLGRHKEFLLRLLENPNLLEHERFTDLLWAVFHLAEELELRDPSLERLPEADYLHLAGDVRRAYSQIAGAWLAYAGHLKENYPFLFSLAARINPFNPAGSPIVRE